MLPGARPPTFVPGTPMDDHVTPPSRVRTIAGHRAVPHGMLPRTQPFSAETNVADIGSNAAGTGAAEDVGDWLPWATGDEEGSTKALDAAGLSVAPIASDGEPPTGEGPAPGRTRIASTATATPAARRANPEPKPLGDRCRRTA